LSLAFVVPLVHFDVPRNIVIIGVITGLTYSLLGMGLTLVYKTSRVLNFAQGDMGAFPALFIPILVLNRGWNYWATLVLALAGSLIVGALFEFLVIRRLRSTSRLTALVATIGGAQVLYVFGLLIPKNGANGSQLAGKTYPTPFAYKWRIGTLFIGPGQILILIVVPVVTIALIVFLQRSRLGRATRAAAENGEAAALAGVPINRVSLAMWAIAGLLAGIAAILVGPTRPINLSAALGPSLMLRGLGAAMLGGLLSLPAAFVGGVAIGVIEALVLWNYPRGGVLEVVIFAIILCCLLLRRGLGHIARGGEESSWSLTTTLRPLPYHLARDPLVRKAKVAGLVLVLAIAVLVPTRLDNSQAFFLSGVILFAMMGVSLVVLTGMAGQISLGQLAFVGIGAAAGGRIYQMGQPHIVGMITAAAIGAVVALWIGLPALRVRGLFLAVTTLGFAISIAAWVFNQPWLVHKKNGSSSLQIPRPRLGSIDFENEHYYYLLCLLVLIAVIIFVHRLRSSQLGQAMVAVRDNESSAAGLAISPPRTKLMAFMISGAIASLAGFLYGGLQVNFSTNPSDTFGAQRSLDLVVLAVLGGVTTITGVVVGAFWIRGIPSLLGSNFGILSSGFGVLAVLLLMPGGLASLLFIVRDRAADWLVERRGRGQTRAPTTVASEPIAASRSLALHERPAAAGPVVCDECETNLALPIRASRISMRYGGLQALDDVSIHAHSGEILGVMGPNGAGKTTLFDTLSGQVRPSAGEVYLDGVDITGLSAHQRARRGLGRTFQQAKLFDDLTVLEALHLALQADTPSNSLTAMLGMPTARRSGRARQAAAIDLIDMLDLGEFRHRYVSELSTGTRRLAELGCVAALGAKVLLLDEPTAGFAHQEVERFVDVVRRLRAHLEATIVVIDHDVPMMLELTDRLYVLDLGVVIAEGSPSLLYENERVAAAYLGDAATTIARRSNAEAPCPPL
jgi:ABC-type branched-subunit amino acid transport system ATPase component/ABC-type branched-subunit amino acid transport system permease subunit